MAKKLKKHWMNTVHLGEIRAKLCYVMTCTLFVVGAIWAVTKRQYAYLIPLCCIGAALLLYIKKRIGVLHAGFDGEKRVLAGLSKLPHDYVIVPDIRIVYGGRNAQIDYILLTPHEVWVVEVKNYAGVLSGEPYAKNLTQMKKEKGGQNFYKEVYNPVLQVKIHMQVLSEFLHSQGFNLPVQRAVVFVGNHFSLQVTWKQENVYTSLEEFVVSLQKREEQNRGKEKIPQKNLSNLLRKVK